jgi:hypothetical protein
MKCPNCGAQSEGAFCSNCGAPLKGAKCGECGAQLSAGARFCNNCGTAAGGTRQNASRGATKLAWLVAGAALVLLIGMVVWPMLRGERSQTADNRVPIDQMGDIGNAGGTPAPGPLTGTPREQADRLFNRVMTEQENGDTAQARFFVPMAVEAYGMAGELDADGYYHLSLLHYTVGNYPAAISTAEKILATSPNHLLALSSAAAAARAAGDNVKARSYYQRFLNAYESESRQTRPEYQDHGNMLPQIRSVADSVVKAR